MSAWRQSSERIPKPNVVYYCCRVTSINGRFLSKIPLYKNQSSPQNLEPEQQVCFGSVLSTLRKCSQASGNCVSSRYLAGLLFDSGSPDLSCVQTESKDHKSDRLWGECMYWTAVMWEQCLKWKCTDGVSELLWFVVFVLLWVILLYVLMFC